jgi:putative phage-type endonuclease
MIEQNTEEWLQYRRSKIGSSDAAIILGFSSYCTPFSLWKRKLGLSSEQKTTLGMQRGKNLESEALYLMNNNTYGTYSPAVIESEEYPYMCASLDGLCITPNKTYACEIKCLNLNNHNAAIKGKILPIYYAQLQHQMLVCSLQEITYVGYHPDANLAMYSFPIIRDEAFLADYIPKAREFWECVQTFTAPELLSKDYRDMSQNPDYRAAEAAYVDICHKLEKLEEQKEQIRVKLFEMSQGKNICGAYTKLTHFFKRGAISYDKIPELKQVDLEQYRKAVIKSSRITRI